MAEKTRQLLEKIPDPKEIRARLAENVQEQALLRQLLRIAERKDRALKATSERGEARAQ